MCFQPFFSLCEITLPINYDIFYLTQLSRSLGTISVLFSRHGEITRSQDIYYIISNPLLNTDHFQGALQREIHRRRRQGTVSPWPVVRFHTFPLHGCLDQGLARLDETML